MVYTSKLGLNQVIISKTLRGRVTIVAIVHGGALLREADRILVLREGRVEALGSWPEVAASASTAAM